MGAIAIKPKLPLAAICANRYSLKNGEDSIENISSSVVEKINKLAAQRKGEEVVEPTTRELVAEAIIYMMFCRDFTNIGSHWSYDGSSTNRLPSDDPNVEIFESSESYVWDWKDIYSVAKGSGTVIIDHEKEMIVVKDYGYYCAG